MLDRNSRNLKRAYECVSANVVRCRAKRAPCNANVHRSRALLTITALAAVAAFGASAPPVAAEHPGPPVERDYYPFFQTSGQSMWGPGGSIAPDDFTQEIISISWDEAVSDSRTVSITAPDVCMDDCAPDIICEAGCWTVCLGCQWLCDHDACIRNCENACPEVCIDACVSDYVNLPGGTFGGEMEASTSGQLSLDARFHGFTSGEVSVDYPVRVRLTTPSIDSFEPGDIIVIDSTDVTRSGATLSTTPPAGAIDIRGTVELSASASADAWLFSRYGTQVTFDAGTSIDIAYPAGETNTLDITPTFQ